MSRNFCFYNDWLINQGRLASSAVYFFSFFFLNTPTAESEMVIGYGFASHPLLYSLRLTLAVFRSVKSSGGSDFSDILWCYNGEIANKTFAFWDMKLYEWLGILNEH